MTAARKKRAITHFYVVLELLQLRFAYFPYSLHCALAAAQCIVIGPVCLCVCVCLWVCYHDNSKLRASILTKLGL